jgi:hypothetical protein
VFYDKLYGKRQLKLFCSECELFWRKGKGRERRLVERFGLLGEVKLGGSGDRGWEQREARR